MSPKAPEPIFSSMVTWVGVGVGVGVGAGVGAGAGVGLGIELEALNLTLTPTLTLEILLSCFLPALQVLDLLAEPHNLGVHRWIKHEGAHLVRVGGGG